MRYNNTYPQYPQYPQYPYPQYQQYPQYPYYPPYPMPDPEELRRRQYKKELEKTSNGLGFLLLIFFGVMLVVYLICSYAIQAGGAQSSFTSGSAVEMLLNGLVSSVSFFVTGIIYCFVTLKRPSDIFPFDRIGGRYAAMIITAGLALCLMSNLAASLMTDVFGMFGLQNTGGEVLEDGAKPSVLLYYLSVAVMPAFAEEFAFRGVILGSLRKYSDALALVVSSAMFALMHGNFVQIPFTFCCGLVFGFAAIKTNSLLPSIVMHFLNNGLSVTYDVLTSYGTVSDEIATLGYGLIFVVTGALALIFMRKIIAQKPDMFAFGDSDDVIPFREKLKTAATSPTLIAFSGLMLLMSIVILVQ